MNRKECLVLTLVLLFVANVCAMAQTVADTRKNGESKIIKLDRNAFLRRVANFEKSPGVWKYLGDKPAIIDFYADWCGPCRRLSPIMDELANEYSEKIYVYKVNVDDEREIASAFGITSLPTIVFVPVNGEPSVGTGFMPKEILQNAIKDILLKNK